MAINGLPQLFYGLKNLAREEVGRVAKEGKHIIKALQRVAAELGEGTPSTLQRLRRFIRPAFGEEFVGIADDFLLEALGQEIARRVNRQMLINDFLSSDASARVPLTHPTVAEKTQSVHHLAS